MGDFLAFRRMITTVIIQVVFWIGVIGSVLGGLIILAGGDASGLLLMIFGPLFVRIYCEILIIIFRMNETLTEIKNLLEKRG